MDNNTVKTNTSKGVRLFAALTLTWFLKTLFKLQLVAIALFEVGIILSHSLPKTQAYAFAFGMQLTLLVVVMLWPFIKRHYNKARRFDLGLWVMTLAVALFFLKFVSSGIAVGLSTASAVQLGAGSLFLYLCGTYAASALFDNYLFSKVLNSTYLGVEPSDLEEGTLYETLKVDDLNAKLSAIEKQAIQDDYRDCVTLNLLKTTSESGPYHSVSIAKQENTRQFVSYGDSYQLEFLVHPFGFESKTERNIFPFYVPLKTIKGLYVENVD